MTAAPAAADLPDFDRRWDYGNPAGSEAAFRELLPRARESGDRSYLVQLLTQVARTYSLRRRFDDAHRLLDEAQSLLRPELTTARVRYLLERGRAFNSAGRRVEAVSRFREAWELGRTLAEADFHTVDAAHMLAIAEPDHAVDWTRKGLAHAEASADPRARGWRGALYNNLGWTLFEQQDFHGALEMLRKSQAAYEEQRRPREVRIARWGVAKTRRMLGQAGEALAVQEALELEWKAAGEDDGYVFEELGECLLALDRVDDARPQFARAYALLSKDDWLVKNEPERVARLKKLGGL